MNSPRPRAVRETSPHRSSEQRHGYGYPISAYLDFVPGGIEYGRGVSESSTDPNTSSTTISSSLSSSSSSSSAAASSSLNCHHYALNLISPEAIVPMAFHSDETLRKFAIRFAHQNHHAAAQTAAASPVTTNETKPEMPPHRLPSLAILAEATFGPLTGVHATYVRKWADAMVLAYLDDTHNKNNKGGESSEEIREILDASEEDLLKQFEELKNNNISSSSAAAATAAPPLSSSPSATSPSPSPTRSPTNQKGYGLVNVLKAMRKKQTEQIDPNNTTTSPMPVRPCGYVFKSNDIAWNCRTCQSDSTCVICDTCFHASDHEGHDVYFHRTTPGGCCDCGDIEAWKSEGCCPVHRPKDFSHTNNDVCMACGGEDENMTSIGNSASAITEDNLDFEAVKASLRGRADGETCVKEMLPPKFAAALGVVIGAAVNAIIQAVDGASIGADPVQWTRRWADQVRRLRDGRAFDEEYAIHERKPIATSISEAMKLEFPNRFQLHLRLHNDDIHTYDEVTDAVYRQVRLFNPTQNRDENDETDTKHGIVTSLDEAKQMTGRVDAEGQAIVKGYSTIKGAMAGFERLKKFGLHCAVLSSPQLELEMRARVLLSWLSDIVDAHPAAAALVVHALVDVTEGRDSIGGTLVWGTSRMIPPWSFSDGYVASARVSIQENEQMDETAIPGWRRRMNVFPPHLQSSFLTREESKQLHSLGRAALNETSSPRKGVDLHFYSKIPYQLPSDRFRKSPHSLWGVMPSAPAFTSLKKYTHPFLHHEKPVHNDASFHLVESLIILETDLRKPQETDMLTHDCYTHSLLGLHMISGVGVVDVDGDENGGSSMKPTAEDWQQILSIASYRAPVSPILLMLLLDPYPPKQLRAAIHPLFLSLLVDSRMKSRFAACLGGIAYRPLTTLYCAGVGTESDSPLSFTVQIFTTGSLVRALCNIEATKKLLTSDGLVENESDAFTIPVAHNIVRCIHTNLLGACKEVKMVLKNTAERRSSVDAAIGAQRNAQKNKHLSALVYQQGESPLTTVLPAAPDDAFLDARSTKHKRLPPLIRDLEYVFDTPGTALRLLLPYNLSTNNEVNQKVCSEYVNGFEVPHFPIMWCRLLRLAQGADPQRRKASGGHVEYELVRWLEAYSLSLHFSGACSKFSESISRAIPNSKPPQLDTMRESMGNYFIAILREMKLWLYKENILDSGLPQTSSSHFDQLQRSTLHVSMATLGMATASTEKLGRPTALNCEVNTKMKEVDLEIIENAIRIEQSQFQLNGAGRGAIMGDWLRVPHSPHAGNLLSFHLPLHRALAKNIRTFCSLVVPEKERDKDNLWWLLPVVDGNSSTMDSSTSQSLEHPLSTLLRPSLRSANCRVVWASGPECDSNEAQHRRSRARAVSAAITAAKIIHSLCDHPLRCLAATEQISRHLWARNGASAVGMAINYSSPPLCQSFRDLDLTMVQLSASGLCLGLGARRVFSLILSRFDLEGYLCDIEKRCVGRSPTNGGLGTQWIAPPNIQDVDHAPSLAEALFTTICVLVTELPPPPPSSNSDDTFIKMQIRRGLLHALSVTPLSYSKAMEAATNAIDSKDNTNGFELNDDSPLSFRTIFEEVLTKITSQKSQGSRPTATPKFELNCSFSDEYDPSFFHLKRADHQHAMDNIARLRKQKFSSKGKRDVDKCLPLVGLPPIAHPRFAPCRLLLHIPALDASIRRALMFALTGGEWTPPEPPMSFDDDSIGIESPSYSIDVEVHKGNVKWMESQSFSSEMANTTRRMHRGEKKTKKIMFSPKVVNDSSVSFLEVLQLLTLQVHTLEDCARLHQTHPILDHEMKMLSASITINSYLGRLVHVPPSLVDAWAFRCAPEGPLPSKGSGLNRASILGLLIALYEHKSDKSALNNDDIGHGEEGLGGARFLVSCGLKWILRYISALVNGAPDIRTACECATNGIQNVNKRDSRRDVSWSIDDHLKITISGMLENLSELWPSQNSNTSDAPDAENKGKNKQAMLAAKKRAMDRMKKQQASFAASISTDEQVDLKSPDNDEEANLCIICRCDDDDRGNNGPMGFLGHVQRSRTQQLRSRAQNFNSESKLAVTYRVVGDKGCQIRANESMDSEPVECLPVGSLVTVKKSKISLKYGLMSRRVLISFISPLDGKVSEGWASVQSAQGYNILSPSIDTCSNNSRWGCTRPIFRLCGHAAHLGCVARHVASIHQKAEQETAFDGRFAAEIGDGEFLCPLCKQLSNIVIPVQENDKTQEIPVLMNRSTSDKMEDRLQSLTSVLKDLNPSVEKSKKIAMKQYGYYLYQAMEATSWNKHRQQSPPWHKSLKSWDFIETFSSVDGSNSASIGDILPLLRQLHISWSATGHLAASAEASSRGIRKSGFDPPTSDPWVDFNEECKDTHPTLLELRRTMVATASLFDFVSVSISEQLSTKDTKDQHSIPIVSALLSDILCGKHWTNKATANSTEWKVLSALLASIPCHVSRDESLHARHEARATAAQIWAVKNGISAIAMTVEKEKASLTPTPPVPKCIRNIPDYKEMLKDDWGTFNMNIAVTDKNSIFRPAIASGFLYIPLLAWDMNTFAGAIFSSLLSSENLSQQNLSDTARILLVARMIQVIVTPNIFKTHLENQDLEADLDVAKENDAINSLIQHCDSIIHQSSKAVPAGHGSSNDLLVSLSFAILPFARTLVLLLRSAYSAARQKGIQTNGEVEDFLLDFDTMYIEDGFYFLQKLGCPMPSEICDSMCSNSNNCEHSFWAQLVNSWMNAIVSFDAYHGSRGCYLDYNKEKQSWTQVKPSANANKKFKSEKQILESVEHYDSTANSSMHVDNTIDADIEGNDDIDMGDNMSVDNAMPDFQFDVMDSPIDRSVVFEDIGDVDEDSAEEVPDVFGLPSFQSEPSHDESIINLNVENSVCSPSEIEDDVPDDDEDFANISSATIIPFQPSILGHKNPGQGPRGTSLDYTLASTVICDISHLGSVHSKDVTSSGLIQLPKSYVELYSLVNKVKASAKSAGLDDVEDIGSGETAICLLTGSILRAGLPRRHSRRHQRPPGACTLHARRTGSGTGVFFLLQKCTVLLLHNKKSAYSASLYVDENGEEDISLTRGRPLFLNDDRYEALENLWRSHGIPREVAQVRSTADRVIRDDWY